VSGKRPNAFLLGFEFMGLPSQSQVALKGSCYAKMQPIISLSQVPPSRRVRLCDPSHSGMFSGLGGSKSNVICCFSRSSLIRTLSFSLSVWSPIQVLFKTSLIKGVCVKYVDGRRDARCTSSFNSQNPVLAATYICSYVFRAMGL
jgi:hypothetical protein